MDGASQDSALFMSCQGGQTVDQDQTYLNLLLQAVRICADYRPNFGQGRKGGLTKQEFSQLYWERSILFMVWS